MIFPGEELLFIPEPDIADSKTALLNDIFRNENREKFIEGAVREEIMSTKQAYCFLVPSNESEETSQEEEFEEIYNLALNSDKDTIRVRFDPDTERFLVTQNAQEISGKLTPRELQTHIRGIRGRFYFFIDEANLIPVSIQANLRALWRYESLHRGYASITSKDWVQGEGKIVGSPLQNQFFIYGEDQVREFKPDKAREVFAAFQRAVSGLADKSYVNVDVASKSGKSTFCKALVKQHPEVVRYLTSQEAEFLKNDEVDIDALKNAILAGDHEKKILLIDEGQYISDEAKADLAELGTKIIFLNGYDF